jgi:glycolate oxidase
VKKLNGKKNYIVNDFIMISPSLPTNRFTKKPSEIEPKLSDEDILSLREILGDRWVNTSIEIRTNYSMDMSEQVAPSLFEVIVMPDNAQEVQKIVQFANERKIPITPYVAGANIGGLTLPHEGGICLDLKRMNRILKIDRKNKFIVIEPGFTFGDLKRLLLPGGSLEGFRYTFPFAPPYTSVLTNALLNGLGSLGVMYGSANNFISGIEVVLPTGEIVEIGQHATNNGEYWIAREPLPDLTGIFIATQGTMGVITKMGIHLIDQPKYSINYAVLPKSADEFLRTWVHELDNLHVCDELGIGYFPAKVAHGIVPEHFIKLMGDLAGLIRKGNWAKFMQKFGWKFMKFITFQKPFPLIKFLAKSHLLPLPNVPDDEPLLIAGITITGQTKGIFEAKKKAFQSFIDKQAALMIEPKEFGELAPIFNSILDLPAQLPAFYDLRGGGLTWVGSYVPPSNVADGLAKGITILHDLGFFPVCVLRPMKSDHYFVLRFIISFNSASQEEVASARKAIDGVSDVILETGGVPYKMSPTVAKKVWEHTDPEFYKLLARVKDLMDPNGIMNPGKLLINGTPNQPYTPKDLTGGQN